MEYSNEFIFIIVTSKYIARIDEDILHIIMSNYTLFFNEFELIYYNPN